MKFDTIENFFAKIISYLDMHKVLRSIVFGIVVGGLSYTGWNYLNNVLVDVQEKSTKNGYIVGYQEAVVQTEAKALQEISGLMKIALKKEAKDCTIAEYILTEKRLHAIMDKSNPKLTKAQKREYTKYITKYSKKFDLNPILVASIIHRESNFINSTKSEVGALGPMQVWPKWHKEKMKKYKLKNEHLHSTNYGILVGCEVLREYIDMEDGDYRAALYRYVGGKHHSYVKDIFAMCEYALTIKI